MGKLADHMKSTHEISIKELTRNYDVYVQEKMILILQIKLH
jgi:lysophospholipase